MSWEARIPSVRQRYRGLTARLAEPEVLNDRDTLRRVAQEQSELAPVVEAADRLDRVRTQLAEARSLIEAGNEAELVELAEAEVEELEAQEERQSAELRR